jgi:hypothetical protein
MRAMINPQTIPFKTATDKLEITNLILLHTATLVASRTCHSCKSRNPGKTGFRVKPGTTNCLTLMSSSIFEWSFNLSPSLFSPRGEKVGGALGVK